ncbi:glucose-1-phosphate cytidylyltransferase [Asticcacaulis tiandongensis]|uniref:glucose-1-phosphate cytidylyltransferase n=1 Tax=Asticcacaulis tiandongensis TaxID=2565365 RepID=UPI00112CB9AB|nr:glucose-1-phosphate cytidylyltransferase [Asticcacaulis tiandongensis]
MVKVALLAGGFGTRLSEETSIRPKPMVEIGGRPIMWHIMKIYAHYGLKDFVILGGYRVEFIRDYFLRYRESVSDFTIDLGTGQVDWLEAKTEDWRITVLDTGQETLTAGRLKRAQKYLENERFCLTYGDGVADVNIAHLMDFHKAHKRWCTLTAVTQPGRFGALHLSEDGQKVHGFREKGAMDGGLINGGFFVCEPEVFDVIDGDHQMWEEDPMRRIIEADQLSSYHHDGYWQSMDSLRDRMILENIWASGKAPWKVWND